MEQYLMTQSLLSSWAYTFNAADGYEDAAMADFLATLRREQKEPSEAMRNGINFENLVYEIAAGKFKAEWDPTGEIEVNSGEPIGKYLYPKGYEGASKVAEIIKGGVIQVKASRVLETAGMNFLVYGILDALKAGTIYDVKYLNKSMGSAELAGKYLESAQHPAYFYIVPEAHEFKYLVSDGKDLYIEQYPREQARPIGDIVEEFIHGIESIGLLETYRMFWRAL